MSRAYFPEHRVTIAELVEQVDLALLVERYAGPGRRTGSSFVFSCPNPTHPDRHPSFTVSRTRKGRQVASCRSQCGWHGNALDLLVWLEGLSVKDAADELRAFLGRSRDDWQPRTQPRPKAAAVPVARPQLPRDTRRPDEGSARRLLGAYISKRGWPLEVAMRYDLSVVLDKFGNARVRHPFFDISESGETVLAGWQDRRCDTRADDRYKWLTTGTHLPLYNTPGLHRPGVEVVVVCEGPADAITAEVALAGFSQVCAVGLAGGSNWQPRFAELLRGREVLIIGDRDATGDLMRQRVGESVVRVAKRCRTLTPPVKDLSEWALRDGFEKVGAVLARAAGLSPSVVPLPVSRNADEVYEEAFRLISAVFPGTRKAVWRELGVAA